MRFEKKLAELLTEHGENSLILLGKRFFEPGKVAVFKTKQGHAVICEYPGHNGVFHGEEKKFKKINEGFEIEAASESVTLILRANATPVRTITVAGIRYLTYAAS